MDDTLTEILKESLPTLKEPVLFQNALQKSNGSYEWKLLEWDINDFTCIFGDKQLPFRIGDHNKRTCTVQHDQCSAELAEPEPICLTFQEFVDKACKLNDDKWFYCDYKHLMDWTDKPEIIASFNWLKFGIDESTGKNGLHSTIWIGSKGAHTDCHRDTYGYNLVAQVHGRKVWLLYPPSNALIPVRVPYEESTVYSRLNIYSLNDEEQCYLLTSVQDKPKLVILEPGDVLFVPNGWWHYVESLDTINISVNLWGKLKTDDRARVEEALVQLLVAKIANTKLQEDNVNMDSYFYTKTVEHAVMECKKKEDQEKKKNHKPIPEERKRKKNKSDVWTARDLAEIYPHYVKLIKDAEQHEFKKFLQERRNRDINTKKQTETKEEDNVSQIDSFLQDLINSLCHPDVINKAAEILLEKFS